MMPKDILRELEKIDSGCFEFWNDVFSISNKGGTEIRLVLLDDGFSIMVEKDGQKYVVRLYEYRNILFLSRSHGGIVVSRQVQDQQQARRIFNRVVDQLLAV